MQHNKESEINRMKFELSQLNLAGQKNLHQAISNLQGVANCANCEGNGWVVKSIINNTQQLLSDVKIHNQTHQTHHKQITEKLQAMANLADNDENGPLIEEMAGDTADLLADYIDLLALPY